MNINDCPFINKLEYFLDHLEEYDLTYKEVVLCSLIIYYNEHHMPLTYQDIAKKLKIAVTDVDALLQELIVKEYLNIKINGQISYDLTNLFDSNKITDDNTYAELLKICEEVFNRVLNVTEMTILNELIGSHPKDKIIEALRSAEVYQNGNPNIYYVKGILEPKSMSENDKKS